MFHEALRLSSILTLASFTRVANATPTVFQRGGVQCPGQPQRPLLAPTAKPVLGETFGIAADFSDHGRVADHFVTRWDAEIAERSAASLANADAAAAFTARAAAPPSSADSALESACD
jgi:hypothetical protein